jgi:hypothetical protein
MGFVSMGRGYEVLPRITWHSVKCTVGADVGLETMALWADHSTLITNTPVQTPITALVAASSKDHGGSN